MADENKPVAIRLKASELAKARDGLLAKGISPKKLNSTGALLKMTFYYGLMSICADVEAPPSEESLNFIKQKFRVTRQGTKLSPSDLP